MHEMIALKIILAQHCFIEIRMATRFRSMSVSEDQNRSTESLVDWIGKFCGQDPEPCAYLRDEAVHTQFPAAGFGHSQLNELLLSLHLDRTSVGFFQYVFGGPTVTSFDHLKRAITAFRVEAIRHFGNLKYAFKRLSLMSEEDIKFALDDAEPAAV